MIKNLITNNWLLKLIALGFACITYLYVRGELVLQ